MDFLTVLEKKKRGGELSESEIRFVVDSYTDGNVPDYQMSAFLMAVCLQGMTDRETDFLTFAIAESGETANWADIDGITVDKHSTGGVGDKTTLIIAPLVASCGLKMPKMSGRGLGHTGGTVDKLESIPSFQTVLSLAKLTEICNQTGFFVCGQTATLAPADKKIYALRDVTGTVDSIPLIVSSVMGKKLACNADCIVFDVKCGSGSFMKTLSDARILAKKLVLTGKSVGKKTAALITDMDVPLGRAVGNALEVREAVDVLQGKIDSPLTELCLSLTTALLVLAEKGEENACRKLAESTLKSGRAFEKLCETVTAQGGDATVLRHPEKLPLSPLRLCLYAESNGYISGIDAEKIGLSALTLGAGRRKKEDIIDHGSGVLLAITVGDLVHTGDLLLTLYSSVEDKLSDAAPIAQSAIVYSSDRPVLRPLVLESIF